MNHHTPQQNKTTQRFQLLPQNHMIHKCLIVFTVVLLGSSKAFPIPVNPIAGRRPTSSVIHSHTLSTADVENVSSCTRLEYESSRLWKDLCPPMWDAGATRDVSITWKPSTTMKTSDCAAEELLDKLGMTLQDDLRSNYKDFLSRYLNDFGVFCHQHLDLPPSTLFQARLVATRGTTGTKCPQWHVDHVPVRWIQSLVGPGCEIVSDNSQGIHWEAWKRSGDEEDEVVSGSVQERNQALVDEDRATIYQGKESEALVLIGNRWREFTRDKAWKEAVVHKSPTLGWGQGRVLLTQDILVP